MLKAGLRFRLPSYRRPVQQSRCFSSQSDDFPGNQAPHNRFMGFQLDQSGEKIQKQDFEWPILHGGYKPQHVLVLSKITRWEVIKDKRIGKDPSDAHLIAKHKQQEWFVEKIVEKLKSHKINVTVTKPGHYTVEKLKNVDLVISAGGDGTFLTAASRIRNNIPVIGINTDPVGSEGHLCLTGKEKRDVGEVIEQFLAGHFTFFYRHRIRVTLLKPSIVGKVRRNDSTEEHNDKAQFHSDDEENHHNNIPLPLLALNEVFVGESHAARVSYLEIQIDDGPVYKQKNSGVIVCTGTGSTSWNYNINRSTERSVAELITFMQEQGYEVKPPLDQNAVKSLCQRYNERLVFAPDEERMEYSIRDPVFNRTFAQIPDRGSATKIKIKSKCSHAHLTLDGSTSIPFNHGAEVLIELYREDALRTALLTAPAEKSS
ncbi:unnamed protein product [Bursaphelenchus xylophilus]|uniref:NAD(+) kinase n=1 Tax=Bursaphelenchus xylophilus TaxID=6326 RepID=A0A1I7S597_BURXY|nr:unnamed protein product [Bursaphelenchus xylophilus]CAG9117846.1 unnamed protein product [Bursaphelenchus xylophilus]